MLCLYLKYENILFWSLTTSHCWVVINTFTLQASGTYNSVAGVNITHQAQCLWFPCSSPGGRPPSSPPSPQILLAGKHKQLGLKSFSFSLLLIYRWVPSFEGVFVCLFSHICVYLLYIYTIYIGRTVVVTSGLFSLPPPPQWLGPWSEVSESPSLCRSYCQWQVWLPLTWAQAFLSIRTETIWQRVKPVQLSAPTDNNIMEQQVFWY